MVSTELDILVDLACSLGNTTRLAKILRNTGFSPRIISHDTLRLRERLRIERVTGDVVARVQSVFDKVKDLYPLWNTLCLEIWAEASIKYSAEPTVAEYDGLCIYARRGVGGKLVLKVAWLNPCKHVASSLIPESITRLCTSSPGTLSTLRNIATRFAEFVPKLSEHLSTAG